MDPAYFLYNNQTLLPPSPNSETSNSNNQSPLLPEIWAEIANHCDIRSKQNLSLVSRKIRHEILISVQIQNQSRKDIISKKINEILKTNEILSSKSYEKITIFFLDNFGYSRAREVFNKIEHPHLRSSLSILYVKYLFNHDRLDEAERIIHETAWSDNHLDLLKTIFCRRKCYQRAKEIIGKVNNPLFKCHLLLDLAENQRLYDAAGSLQTLREIVPIAISIPLSETTFFICAGTLYPVIQKCHFISNIALGLFKSNDLNSALSLLHLAIQNTFEIKDNPLLQGSTLTCLGEAFVKLGRTENGFALLEEAKRITQDVQTASLLPAIAHIYKNPNVVKSQQILQEALVQAGIIKKVSVRFNTFEAILQCLKSYEDDDDEFATRCFSQMRESIQKTITEEFFDSLEKDSLLLHLACLEIERELFDNTKLTSELIEDPYLQWKYLFCYANTLMKRGQTIEGKQIFLKAAEILFTIGDVNAHCELATVVCRLAKYDFLDDALEIAKRIHVSFTQHYMICELIKVQLQMGNLHNAKLLLNHLPDISPIKAENVIPLLNIAEFIAKRSSPQEKDTLMGSNIHEAIKLIEAAITILENERMTLAAPYICNIARTIAKIGDIQGAQNIMHGLKVNVALNDQIHDKKALFTEIALLQDALYDFDGALDTIELLKDDLESYIDTLLTIGRSSRLF